MSQSSLRDLELPWKHSEHRQLSRSHTPGKVSGLESFLGVTSMLESFTILALIQRRQELVARARPSLWAHMMRQRRASEEE